MAHDLTAPADAGGRLPAEGSPAIPPALSGEDDLALIVEATAQAGRIALALFGRDPRVSTKADRTEVTEADLAADAFLRERLLAARPGYGWLSEETTDDLARLDRRATFVVDPIDGTKGFIDVTDRWVVSVALVVDGRPTAGCLVRPVTGDVYLAAAGRGAFRNGEPIAASRRTALEGARLAGPRSLLRRAGAPPPFEIVPYIPSLALRLALVAAGELDAVVTNPGSSDWDLAAADLLVHEAGGRLASHAGHLPRYNERGTGQRGMIASGPGLADPVRRLVAERAVG